VIWLPARLRASLERHLFGLTADEIRYTFEDVRQELRATRDELREELAVLRRDLDRLAGKEAPHPAARGEGAWTETDGGDPA
jgi:hypothetical protein